MNHGNKQAVKVVLVTGAARRIGAAIVNYFHEAGFHVIIHCHDSLAQAQVLALNLNEKRPASAHIVQKNLCAPLAAEELIAESLALTGRLDVLVNNASIFKRSEISQSNQTDWDDLLNTNLKAPYLISLVAYPHLARQQGVIINLTDIHAQKPLKGYALYCQTKAALEMQTKALAREFAPEVRVNAVAPGAIAWPEQENALGKEMQQKIIESTPLKRHGDPLSIAKAVFALAENSFLTGQILNVDGGRSLS